MTNNIAKRQHGQAGVAIGPILFIIAILAILTVAIIAGSGTSGTQTPTKNNAGIKASALIRLGDNLKRGMDRLTIENSVGWGDWVIDATKTSGKTDLFSPTGGGITVPSTALAADPVHDHWYYPTGAVNGLGSRDQLAVLRVTGPVCVEINRRVQGMILTDSLIRADLGDFAASNPGVLDPSIAANWPVVLNGKPIGCVKNTGKTAGYFFYQVLYID